MTFKINELENFNCVEKCKNIFFLFLFISITNVTFSQKVKNVPKVTSVSSSYSSYGFSKGDFVVTGAFGVKSSSVGGTSSTSFKILPSLGYFVSDKIAIGGTLGYVQNGSGSGIVNTATNDFIVGLFGRYYMKPKSQFTFFGQGLLSFVSSSPQTGNGSSTTFGLGFSPGLNYFVSNRFSLEATFGEIGFKSTSVSGGGSSNTGFNFGFDLTDIGFGLNYKF
jgi:hypothetical protein